MSTSSPFWSGLTSARIPISIEALSFMEYQREECSLRSIAVFVSSISYLGLYSRENGWFISVVDSANLNHSFLIVLGWLSHFVAGRLFGSIDVDDRELYIYDIYI